tara:strand:+ start:246 stop:377 length:132 start_codon:yes stop_codon:yes gene_type:complete
MYETNAFESEIFDYCRKLNKEIQEAVVLLKTHGYVVYEKGKKK